jgi:hypothetical protein
LRILIDGEQAADLNSGDECELSVYAGLHRLDAHMGWPVRDGSIHFTIAAGDTLDFICKLTGRVRGQVTVLTSPSSRIFGAPPPPPSHD